MSEKESVDDVDDVKVNIDSSESSSDSGSYESMEKLN